jgi:hypothetical protein
LVSPIIRRLSPAHAAIASAIEEDRSGERHCGRASARRSPDPIYFKKDIRVTIQQIGFTPDKDPEDPLYHTGAPIYNAGPGLVEKEKGAFGLFERPANLGRELKFRSK